MPTTTVNNVELYYEESGSGPETIVFSHGLLMSSRMFSGQIEALKGRYRCIAYDHRGQGRSEVTRGGYDMDNIAQDAAGLIRALGAAPCHFVGLSMGGFTGMRLAIHHPELLSSLILMDTSADPEPNVRPYRQMAFVGRWLGFGLVIDRVMKIMFGNTFMKDPDREAERQEWRRHILENDRKGITRAAHGVIDRQGVYERLNEITTPTLVIVGDEDTATTPAKARRISDGIANARLAVIPGAGHSSSVEQPALVCREMEEFLSGIRKADILGADKATPGNQADP